jgi:xanthine dehydrogenase YagS FAD-binding subunit
MHLPTFEYLKPDSIAEAVRMLGQSQGRAAILAGGTDLMASMGQRLNVPEQLISIRGLSGLRGVEVHDDGGVRIAAGTTLTDLVDHPGLADALPMFHQAVRSVASVHVRNMATLGGNLALPTRCWYTNQTETWRNAREGCFKTDREQCHVLASSHRCVATSSADTVPALIALNAAITAASIRGEREIPLASFYRDDGAVPTVLEKDELIASIRVPAMTGRGAFVKVTPREGIDFGLGNIAVVLNGTNEDVRSARIVVNAIGSHPMRLIAAEAALCEQGLTTDGIETATQVARYDLGEITNLWTPAGYKRRLVRTLLRRALQQVAANGGAAH